MIYEKVLTPFVSQEEGGEEAEKTEEEKTEGGEEEKTEEGSEE